MAGAYLNQKDMAISIVKDLTTEIHLVFSKILMKACGFLFGREMLLCRDATNSVEAQSVIFLVNF